MQLIEISGSLVCDADVLANISRISSPLSPISTRSPESSLQRVPTESAQYNEVVDRNELAKTDEGLRKPLDKLESSSQVADINASPEWSGQQLSESALLEESILTNDSDRFADATKNMSLRQKTSREVIVFDEQPNISQLTTNSLFLFLQEVLDRLLRNLTTRKALVTTKRRVHQHRAIQRPNRHQRALHKRLRSCHHQIPPSFRRKMVLQIKVFQQLPLSKT